MGETAAVESAHSEHIFLTPSGIYCIFLWLLKDNVKTAGNTALGESVDVEAFIGV